VLKTTTAEEIGRGREFRRVLFRSRLSATTLPPSHGNSSLLPRKRSTVIDGIISAGKLRVALSKRSSRSGASLTPRARPTAATSRSEEQRVGKGGRSDAWRGRETRC